jgi:phage baseplate assembly protein gpV
MSSLLNQMFLTANRYNNTIGYVKLGLVSDSNPNTSQIKVLLQPEGTETGWIPYSTPWIGWFAPPNAGDHVMVHFQEGVKDVPLAATLLYWVQAQPPAGVALGEALWQHSSGASIKLNNDGQVVITGKPDVIINTDGDLTATVGGDLNANVTGDAEATIGGTLDATVTGNTTLTTPQLTLNGAMIINGDLNVNGTIGASGNITDLNGANGSLNDIRTVYNSHIHSDPQGGDTGPADPQMP